MEQQSKEKTQNRKLYLTFIFLMIFTFIYSVPPHPQSYWKNDQSFSGISEIASKNKAYRACDIPDSILVLRCDFTDVGFDMDENYPPGNPDIIPHNDEYFERILFHLSAYWRDVSHGHYNLQPENFTLHSEVFSLSREMGYYGDDAESTQRVSEMIVELLDMADDSIDFSKYDSYIIIHAGAGQEADTSGNNKDDIWTTFVTRKTLQEGLDPENDNFPGLEYDGKILKEFVILPETERQPDVESGDPIFGILGVVCHEFGRQIGLPTLYDNQSSNGSSAGIGNYGVMGTGLWNAAGFVPPLPCAWSRIYMGWEIENLVVIDENHDDLELLYALKPDGITPTIYRIMISEDEYFLIENRRQNPDGSTFINNEGDTLATFSFELTDNQQYYGEGHPYEGQPFFSFLENSYEGCEWDFYLPGYGEGDAMDYDGSGICIWHIDENVMAEKFNLEEEINVPNGEAEHKAVDLEEADRDQGLDRYGYYGHRDDTYRAGNNSYFGYQMYNGFPWTPTAESYYGGIRLEIYDISMADSIMTFSVGYEWSLDAGYAGKNMLPAAFLDYGDGIKKLFYAMPDGKLCLWENNTLIDTEELSVDSLSQCWSWDSANKRIIIPGQSLSVAKLYAIAEGFVYESPELYIGWEWAAPVIVTDSGNLIIGMNSTDGDSCAVIIKDNELNDISRIVISDYNITANMMFAEGNIYVPVLGADMNAILTISDFTEFDIQDYSQPAASYHPEFAAYYKNINNDHSSIVFTSAEDRLIKLSRSSLRGEWECKDIELPFQVYSYPSFADISGDGKKELLLGGENSFLIMNELEEFSFPSEELSSPDSTGMMAGVIAIDNGEEFEITGLMSQNRLCVWENVENNNYVVKRNYPISFASKSMNYPIINDGFLYIAAYNGKIYRDESRILPEQQLSVKFVNLQRTASVVYEEGENQYETSDIFVNKETYVYPNPYSKIFSAAISDGVANAGKVAIRMMLSESETVEIKIYDIAGNQVYHDKALPFAYNAYNHLVDVSGFSSGVYFVKLEAGSGVKILKFGIEK